MWTHVLQANRRTVGVSDVAGMPHRRYGDIRVREAAGQRVRRQISVEAQKPADLLGVYIYLPEVSA
jgi:hypothetical protein